ncbi:MgtC/SapB family protein [Nostoc sp.]|uniref:MgtC/SapB family protein n=1 Tax=unclassified Nostoc TaxID=2593658 RepID=UPI002FFB8692
MGPMFIAANDWPHIAFRLSLALLVGCLIGFNRQQGGRPAGMRTFMLVSMGAALFVMIPLQAEGESPYAATNALSRTIQGVATGVGFLGAGLILQESPRKSATPKVKGLTTAACSLDCCRIGGCNWLWFVANGIIGRLTDSDYPQWGKAAQSRICIYDESW